MQSNNESENMQSNNESEGKQSGTLSLDKAGTRSSDRLFMVAESLNIENPLSVNSLSLSKSITTEMVHFNFSISIYLAFI
jgi:hypothetical protein